MNLQNYYQACYLILEHFGCRLIQRVCLFTKNENGLAAYTHTNQFQFHSLPASRYKAYYTKASMSSNRATHHPHHTREIRRLNFGVNIAVSYVHNLRAY